MHKTTKVGAKPARTRQKPNLQQSVFQLSAPEKLQLVEDLWDDLAAAPADVLIPEWHKEELERRKTNLQNHPASSVSWEELQRRVRLRSGR